MAEYYRRHLPHQIPKGFPIFVTWNLKGSLPRHVREELQAERKRLESQSPEIDEPAVDRKERLDRALFHRRDCYLDGTTQGPLHLGDPRAARIVVDSILFGTSERYDLYAFVVMPNHVHLLLTPHWDLHRITKGIKGFTANRINRLHDARGRVFWQDESYDHWVRDEEEFFRVIEYIENNPVAAGLCGHPEDWIWSSAAQRRRWPFGQPYRPKLYVGLSSPI